MRLFAIHHWYGRDFAGAAWDSKWGRFVPIKSDVLFFENPTFAERNYALYSLCRYCGKVYRRNQRRRAFNHLWDKHRIYDAPEAAYKRTIEAPPVWSNPNYYKIGGDWRGTNAKNFAQDAIAKAGG